MKNSSLKDIQIIDIPVIVDEEGRGKLSVIEKDIIPFKIERVYYLYDVPSDAYRGGHAHKELIQLLIPLSGSFDVKLEDGRSTEVVRLNKPNKGLLIPTGIWRELENFSAGAVCLVLASNEFNEADYIWDYDTFIDLKKS
ncbi:MAG: FdtA/QdtA family cupin domain-containing protein [Bacteroidia bacterium]|nr:FdtA/QdtA family cupin domain-containing protein [Bacteroidia bacterium]NND51456.1 WxcM-like domain-containing protein [Flavobacteriaceae bacterium]